jgi:3-oxoadipate enol-lactonase
MSPTQAGVTPSGLAFTVTGSGPPLLWLSGYAAASTAVDRYIAAFSGSYTCIAFDARGSGLTRPATWRLTTTSMAYDALEVLRYVGHDSAHVHGLSLGGMVAQEVAIRAPHRVRTLVLGATTAGGTAATPARLNTMWSSLFVTRPSDSIGTSVSWRGALQQAMAASMHDSAARLGRVQAPTLVMHGGQDRLLPPENAEALARLIPRAELVLIPRAGHFYPIKATQESAAAVLAWMEAHRDVAPGTQTAGQELAYLLQDALSAPLRLTRAQLMPLRHTYRIFRPTT